LPPDAALPKSAKIELGYLEGIFEEKTGVALIGTVSRRKLKR